MPNSYPGLSPDPNQAQIIDSLVVERVIFDDMLWRTRHGFFDSMDINLAEGSRFFPDRTVLDRQTGTYSVMGSYVLHRTLEGRHPFDVTQTARIEATDVHWLHAAWRKVRQQPPAVVMTIWKVPEEADNPPSY